MEDILVTFFSRDKADVIDSYEISMFIEYVNKLKYSYGNFEYNNLINLNKYH